MTFCIGRRQFITLLGSAAARLHDRWRRWACGGRGDGGRDWVRQMTNAHGTATPPNLAAERYRDDSRSA